MSEINIEISVDLIEELFESSLKCREFAVCTTTILELKHSVENYLQTRLVRGNSISLRDAFENALSDIVTFEEDWDYN